jgi:hypothetical protein
MDEPGSNGRNPPPPLDFERASLTWVTKNNSRGRWRLIASAACWSPQAGEHDRFVLAPKIMAGDVYGAGMLPLDPPYGFQIAASAQRHLIMRDFESGLPNRDSSDSNLDLFSQLVIDAPRLQCRRLDPALVTPHSIVGIWPLTARLHAVRDGVEHLVDFPVLHVNTRQNGKPAAFQVETGPVLLPEALIEDPALVRGGFALAYVFFNRLDRLDLAVCAPAGAPPRWGYVHSARCEDIAIELYGGSHD